MADEEEQITLDRDGWRKLRQTLVRMDQQLARTDARQLPAGGIGQEPAAWYKLDSGQVLTPGGSCTAKRQKWNRDSEVYEDTQGDSETIYDPHTKHFASNQCVVWCQLSPHSGLVEVLVNPRTLYRFTLNEAWTANVADADILLMDGTDTTLDADVYDPLSAFTDLVNGDPGICILQDGKFYAIQAPCS